MDKYIGYLWQVIFNISILILEVIILLSADINSVRMIYSLLIIIYLNIIAFFSFWSLNASENAFVRHNEFRELKLILKGELTEDDELDDDELGEFLSRFRTAKNKFLINSIFNIIAYIIAIVGVLISLE